MKITKTLAAWHETLRRLRRMYPTQTFWCIYTWLWSLLKILYDLLVKTTYIDKIAGLAEAAAIGPVVTLGFLLALRRRKYTAHAFMFHTVFLQAVLAINAIAVGTIAYAHDMTNLYEVSASVFGTAFGFVVVMTSVGLIERGRYSLTHKNSERTNPNDG